MQIHDDENKNFCNDCEKGFSTKYHYEVHIRTVHSQNQQENICNICEKSFSSKSNLARHQETKHMETDRFNCSKCEKVFERKDNLIRHERTEHNEQRRTAIIPGINENVTPYPCYICDNVYTQYIMALCLGFSEFCLFVNLSDKKL